MSLPLNKRDFDVFLSHAHKDHVFVAGLDEWLRSAGLAVWYDARELAGGAMLATDLQAAIERCRGIVLIASDQALRQGWVKNEYNSAMDERANDEHFRVVALRIANADVSSLMKGVTWIDVPNAALDRDVALALLRAFYPGEKRPNPATARDVYVSCSWHKDDAASSLAVCGKLIRDGFRLIGDAVDRRGFGKGESVRRIMSSCGAFVCCIPYRGVGSANAVDKPYKYFIQEMDDALAAGLPRVIVSDPRVKRTDGPDDGWLHMETENESCPPDVAAALSHLSDEWQVPASPQYIFMAMDLEADAARVAAPLRHLIERVTGMPTVVGNEIHEEPLHGAIVNKIRGAFLVLADITDDNVNACIEAGMGLAARTNVEIVARGASRRPPFMLRSLQLDTYATELEQVALAHRVVRPYRRRVFNAEL